jgi:hypothetical protein
MLGLILLLATATPPAPVPAIPEVRAYLTHLERLQARDPKETVEATFTAALQLHKALVESTDSDYALIERLTEAEFQALEKGVPGVVFGRVVVPRAEPASSYFLSLAQKYGRPADVAFFRNYIATRPEGLWASYIEMQTDDQGCTLLGKGELVARYSGWLRFRAAYPKAYATTVGRELGEIEESIAEWGCVCGTREEALRELQTFANRFPRSRVIKQVRQRVRELRQPTVPRWLDCDVN